METEIWKDIVGYEGYFMVSDLGRVKSLAREVETVIGKTFVSTKLLRPSINSVYATVALSIKGEKKSYTVHRLVAAAFADNPNKHNVVNHINADKKDNRAINLEWVTQKENVAHALAMNLWPNTKNQPSKSRKIGQFKDGVLIAEYPSTRQVKRDTGFAASGVSMCASGAGYKGTTIAHGYEWKYI